LAEVEAILADSRAAAEYERAMESLLGDAGTGLDASQEASAERELEALVEEEEREAREDVGRLPAAPRREAEREKEGEEALPSAPTGVAVVVGGGGKEKEEGGTEEEAPAARQKERVPVLAA
jgi:hypothetical protein